MNKSGNISKRNHWGEEKQKYGKEHATFIRCHNRVRDGKCPSIEWPRNTEGFKCFLNEIGPMPTNMFKPSIGRKDHSLGYITGNIQWEEHAINSTKRKGTRYEKETKVEFYRVDLSPKFKKGSPEWHEHQKKATNIRWSKPGQREEMSKRMIGNNHAFSYNKERRQ
jgi:hypothetical protein